MTAIKRPVGLVRIQLFPKTTDHVFPALEDRRRGGELTRGQVSPAGRLRSARGITSGKPGGSAAGGASLGLLSSHATANTTKKTSVTIAALVMKSRCALPGKAHAPTPTATISVPVTIVR
jgi:hypothetical protein